MIHRDVSAELAEFFLEEVTPKPSQKLSVGFCLETKWGKEPKPVPFPQLDETRMSELNPHAPIL